MSSIVAGLCVRRWFVWVAAAFAAMILACAPAHAQGGIFLPSPMTAAEIKAFAHRMGLSREQKFALSLMHEAYIQRLRVELPAKIDEHRVFHAVNWSTTTSQWYRREQEVRQDINRLVRRADEALFAELHDVLTEQQQDRLEHVRAARAVDRLKTLHFSSSVTRPLIDIGDVVLRCGFTNRVLRQCDDTLIAYQAQLLRRVRSLSDTLTDSILTIKLAVEAEGFETGIVYEDAKIAAIVSEIEQRVSDRENARADSLVAAIAALNRRTVDALCEQLPQYEASVLRTACTIHSYPLIAREAMHLARMIPLTSELDQVADLSAEQRQQIDDVFTPAADGCRGQLAVLIEQCELAFRQQAVVEFVGAEPETLERIETLRAEFMQRVQEAAAGLERLLTESQQEELADIRFERIALASRLFHESPAQIQAVERARRIQAVTEVNEPPDQFIPYQITPTDVRLYSRVLGCDAGQTTEINRAFAQYDDAYDRFEDKELAPLIELRDSMFADWEDTPQYRQRMSRRIDELFDRRAKCLAEVTRLDTSFFERVKNIVGEGNEAALAIVVAMRERDRINRGYPVSGLGSSASTIDVAELALTLIPVDDAIHPALLAEFTEYSAKVMPHIRVLYDTAVTFLKLDWQRYSYSGPFEQWFEHTKGELRRLQHRLNSEADVVSRINDQTLASVCELLPEQVARSLRDQYRRATNAMIFVDFRHDQLETAFSKALELDDLRGGQRTRVENLILDYRALWEESTSIMHAMSNKYVTTFINALFEDIVVEQRVLRYSIHEELAQRREHTSRAIWRLELLLTDAQLERVGPLPSMEY